MTSIDKKERGPIAVSDGVLPAIILMQHWQELIQHNGKGKSFGK